ncbi:MAG: molybdopterin molybdotransferase MoeA [Hyphomicrobiaceae bacterium]
MAEPKVSALSVAEARARILADVAPVSVERVAIGTVAGDAAPRVLALPRAATLTQPPFDASAMDGYAVRRADVAALPASLTVIGEAAAGSGFGGHVGPGEAVRIFTGAPLPDGADAIIIQEDTARDGERVIVRSGSPEQGHIRTRGFDFCEGDALLAAGRRLTARDITLAAAMGHGALPLYRRPRVALIATGNELVMPGTAPGADQIVCSNPFGIAQMVVRAGGAAEIMPIARDDRAELATRIRQAAGADVIVTIGGASVGDHDLVGPVLSAQGMALDFWKIAMRPGKPLMFGRLGAQRVLGLPGNPVSSLICARVFLVPLIDALLGASRADDGIVAATADVAIEANGQRAHYMRATSRQAADGRRLVRPVSSQDSSLLAPLAAADCLIIRPVGAPALAAGGEVAVLPLDF